MTDLPALVSRFGSPLYVYRLESVRDALLDLRRALPEPTTLYYSFKANPHPDIARELQLGGCHGELSSTGELAAALQAGFDGGRCLYTGPAKSREEISAAIRAGVRRFSVESAADLRGVGAVAAALGVTAECLVRISTRSVGASSLRMGGGAQFGVDAGEVLADPRQFGDIDGARVVGAHIFPLSNAHDEDALIAEFTASIELAGRLRDGGLPMRVIDLGGGFAAPYAQPGERPRYPRLLAALESALDARLAGWREGNPEVAFESGRHLVAESGTLVTTVVDIKEDPGRSFVLLDSGINHLGGMAGLGRLLRPAATPRRTDGDEYAVRSRRPTDGGPGTAIEDGGRAGRTTLVGPLCTPADVLGRDVPVGKVAGGELLIFPNVGAYGLTASLLAFLSRPTPTEIVLRDGRVTSATRLELVRTAVEDEPPAGPEPASQPPEGERSHP
ncbi:type III PLP-dependent enzyme [Streptomyces sp. NPDC005408]|uniref:type III PLP-dependent enzyme n=1 Tax=Streptomyces sp. NPDC005408 TaxID=3155341 RepID=UPI0033A229AE